MTDTEATIARLAESGITLAIGPWVNVPDYLPASNELNQSIIETFSVRKIPIALPQCEIRLLQNEKTAQEIN